LALCILDEDCLILSTIHSAKGQEWIKVFVLSTVDGCIPIELRAGSEDEIEEERRLLYVAMARTKDSLHLITPQRFFVSGQAARGDRHMCASRTSFIPASILSHFEQTAWPKAGVETSSARSPRARVELGAKMHEVWKYWPASGGPRCRTLSWLNIRQASRSTAFFALLVFFSDRRRIRRYKLIGRKDRLASPTGR